MTSLDTLAARAVTKARLLERAVHDVGPWWVLVGDRLYVAARLLLEDRVSFVSSVHIAPKDESVALLCGDDEVSWRHVPSTGDLTMTWDVLATEGALRA